ncbi:MAG: hypothetical protein ACM3YE_02410 [Bacteroidota bacterium]
MNEIKKEFMPFCWRVVSLHVIVYFLAGIFAVLFLNYEELFNNGTLSLLMRPVDSPIVAAGPGLQIINGFFMSLYLFPFKSVFISGKKSWIKLFLLLAGFSLFSPQSPTFGTLEGIIYTKIPIQNHLLSVPECLVYSLLFSVLLFMWYKKPKKAWNILSVILVMLIVLTSVAGVLSKIGVLKTN